MEFNGVFLLHLKREKKVAKPVTLTNEKKFSLPGGKMVNAFFVFERKKCLLMQFDGTQHNSGEF